MANASPSALIGQVNQLGLGTFRFVFRAETEAHLPPFKGSTLRGAFGARLKRLVCVRRDLNCETCLVRPSCTYTHIFETQPPEGVTAFRGQKYAPRPFVLDVPLEKTVNYAPGDPLSFGLTLIGRAIDYLPYIIFSLDQAGQRGLGQGRGRFTLEEVFWRAADGDERLIYDNAAKRLAGGRFVMDIREVIDRRRSAVEPSSGDPPKIKLRFLTPARVRKRGDLQAELTFHELMRNVLRRLWHLMLVHGDGELALDHRALIERAESVEVVSSEIDWVDWERYSSRQKTRMRLGGFVGDVEYGFARPAEVAQFLPLLIVGEVLHIGTGTTFGLGKYEIGNAEAA